MPTDTSAPSSLAPAQPRPPRGPSATLRLALNAGVTVGVVAGLADAIAAAAGFDSEFFLLHARLEGLAAALPSPSGAAKGLVRNAGCLLAAACVYGLMAGLSALALALVAHPGVRGWSLARRRRVFLSVAWGLWLGLLAWWWTRPVLLPGLSSLDPARLAVLAGMLVLGQLVGFALVRLGARLPRVVRRATPFAVVALLGGGALYLATDSPGDQMRGAPRPRTAGLPNVLVFIVDALRADVLGAYGNQVVDTPTIDELARRGVLFERAYVQAPFTWSSFGSFLTGKYPRRHGLVKMAPGVRMAPNITFPFHLRSARRENGAELQPGDYVGAAFMTGTLSHGSGLLRGFDLYCEALVGHGLVNEHSRWSRFRSKLLPWLFQSKLRQRVDRELVATTAASWIRENPDRRFVSMVHYYSTHTPYDPTEPHRSRYVDPAYAGPFQIFDAVHREAIEDGRYHPTEADVRQIEALYHGGVSQADAMIGRVLEELERQGRLDETIIVVTSDHGEELGEHGVWEHNYMYQTNLHIPLIVVWPGRVPAGMRTHALVESVDLFPTLCDLMDLELPRDPAAGERGRIDGVSLVPLMQGEVDAVRRFSFAENGRFVSIQDLERKLIVRRELLLEPGAWETMLTDPGCERPRFFDLVDDPGELENAFDERQEEARELFGELLSWDRSMPIGQDLVQQSERDLRNESLLNSLGYAGGVGQGFDEE